MNETNPSGPEEQLADRLIDILLEEGLGERLPPDLGAAIMHTVTARRRTERVMVLAVAAGIAAILALLTPDLLQHAREPADRSIAQGQPHPVPLPPAPAPAPAPTPEIRVPPVPKEYLAEARRWPPPVPAPEPRKHFDAELPESEWKKLPAFEAAALAKADQAFAGQQYRKAVTSYDAFTMEHPRSAAIPYAILRKGRALQLEDRRLQAISVYQDIIDYFPAAIAFAAPALFHIGECHLDNGDGEKAVKAWLEMATDKDYRQHPLAASAMNRLADSLWRRGELDTALTYYRRVAREFRHAAPAAGLHAVLQVAGYHAIIEPDEPALRKWYRDSETFEPDPHSIPAGTELTQDSDYWRTVLRLVGNVPASFDEARAHLRRQCLAYWLDVLDARMPRREELLIALADLRRTHTGNTAAWAMEMDAVFESGYKPGDTDRILRWLGYYRELPDRAAKYCAMIDTTRPEIASLNPDAKAGLAMQFGAYDARIALRIIAQIPDTGRRLRVLVDYYHALGPDAGSKEIPLNLHAAALSKDRLAAASELAGIEEHARHAQWMKAQFLQWDKRYEEAIKCCRAADNPPDNLWAIAENYKALGNFEQAIQQLVEIEHFFPNQAPKAALMQARIYAVAGKRSQQIATLRKVMKTYRLSGESAIAHRELERLGTPIGGGADVDEENRKKEDAP